VIYGIWAMFPYLVEEHRRLEPWKIGLIWIGDATALLWFIGYCVKGGSVSAADSHVGRSPLARRWFVAAAVASGAAVLADASFTAYLMWDEHAAFAQGVPVTARVESISTKRAVAANIYSLQCAFPHDEKGPIVTSVRVYEPKRRGAFVMPPALPGDVAMHLRSAHAHFPLQLRYDPRWPWRCWIDALGAEDENRLEWFSFFALFFQAIVLLVFLLILSQHLKRGGVPWWRDLHKVLPLGTEAFIMVLFGTIQRTVFRS